MKVKLSIVGFYFGIEVKVPSGSTISDVMKAAQEKSEGSDKEFSFSPDRHGFMANISVNHITEAKSRNSGNTNDPGVYSYSDENEKTNPALVWQYYIFDNDDQRREPRGSEVPFMKNKTKLKDGDHIIWRLVAICTGPTQKPTTKERLMLS